ncbi:MAG: pyridoxamine kinase [Candidatus Fimadaptatus sp.]
METMRVGVMAAVVGYGRSAMAVSVPALAALGCQPCAMPTAVLSSHPGGFRLFQMQDMTGQLERQIEHYAQEQIDMDALMTGYLYNLRQQELAMRFISQQRSRSLGRVLIDPVMGDNGTPYKIITPELMEGMRTLVRYADIITPNMSEACWLLGREFTREPLSRAEAMDMARALAAMGPRQVVITSVHIESGWANLYYDAERHEQGVAAYEVLERQYPGTGDLFAAVLMGSVLGRGMSIEEAVMRAGGFVYRAVKRTIEADTPTREGVHFEALLGELAGQNPGTIRV